VPHSAVMPKFNRSVRRGARSFAPAPSIVLSRCRAVMVIDNRPLQHAAWSEFHAARKRSEKAAADLHRHEETDTPAYEAWLHGTFPVLITTLRELHQQVVLKTHQVESVQWM